mgnify:CR=1 FL=1
MQGKDKSKCISTCPFIWCLALNVFEQWWQAYNPVETSQKYDSSTFWSSSSRPWTSEDWTAMTVFSLFEPSFRQENDSSTSWSSSSRNWTFKDWTDTTDLSVFPSFIIFFSLFDTLLFCGVKTFSSRISSAMSASSTFTQTACWIRLVLWRRYLSYSKSIESWLT